MEWVVTALDIDDMMTARHELEDVTELVGLSQEAAGAGAWNLDLQTGCVTLSRESARLHDIGDVSVEIDLARWSEIVDRDDATKVLADLQAAVDAKTTYNGAFRVRTGDGTVRWLSGIGRASYDHAGQPLRMIGLNFDITERKDAGSPPHRGESRGGAGERSGRTRQHGEERLPRQHEHEIRTPLNSIIGYTDLIMEDVVAGSPIQRKLDVVKESGAALLTIVNDILDFSKIEAGQVELSPTAFSPRALLANVASMMASAAQRKDIAITRYISTNVPDFVSGDENRLRQVLLNLVSNAVKFTNVGRVAINIERVTGTDMVSFSVADTGIGISEDHRERLFHRFSQGDGSISRKFGGTGLGLAICKQLVELMQGTIGAESRKGGGTRFWFIVPLPLADRMPDEPPVAAGKTSARRARILLAEDIVVNQDLAKAVLESAGHVVDVVSNGAQAVDAVRAKDYDIVLMDIQMPVMDGMAATQAIRAADHPSRTVPIVAMTANVLPQQIAGLKAVGMDDHVGKPFRRPDLFAVVDRWTRRPCTRLSMSRPRRRTCISTARCLRRSRRCSGRPCSGSISRGSRTSFRSRFRDVRPSWDPERLYNEAHAMVQPAGLFGFKRLLSICQALNDRDPSANTSALVAELEEECTFVLAEVDRYLGAS